MEIFLPLDVGDELGKQRDSRWTIKMVIDKVWKQWTRTNAKKTWVLSLTIDWSYTTCFNNKNHKHKYIQITHLQHEIQRYKNIQATKDNGNFNNWQHNLQKRKTRSLFNAWKFINIKVDWIENRHCTYTLINCPLCILHLPNF